MFKKALTAAVAALTGSVSQHAKSDPATSKGDLTMPKDADRAVEATMLDDAALSEVAGGGNYTGGRFQLNVGGYSVGYNRPAPSPPPPVKP